MRKNNATVYAGAKDDRTMEKNDVSGSLCLSSNLTRNVYLNHQQQACWSKRSFYNICSKSSFGYQEDGSPSAGLCPLKQGIFPVIPWSAWTLPRSQGGLGILDLQ